MFETVEATRISLNEQLLDPQVSLGEALTKAGLEGLTAHERLDLIEQATVEDYLSAADIIHRKVAPEHSHEPHPAPMKLINPYTPEVVYAATPSERAGILNKALDNAKKVVAKYRAEGGNPDDALQRCGNLAAFGIVLAHIYEGGNGRTARTMGEVIHQGYDSQNPESVTNLAVVSANRPSNTSGSKILSYNPVGKWYGQADVRPLEFLDVVAALDAPLDGQSYQDYVRGSFTTPRMA